MYTGTLINDLMATVDEVRQKAEQQKIAEELHAIYTMQVSVPESDQILTGAA